MADRIVEEHVVHTGGGGSSMTLVAVVLLILAFLAVLYFTRGFGMFGGKDTNINVDIKKPGIVLLLPGN